MQPISPYRNSLVRDLHWALSSPPLIRPAGSAGWIAPSWFTEIAHDYQPRLLELDRDPGSLRNAVQQRTDKRLGAYFEALWRFWLETNGRYRLIHANLPLRDARRTLGELDLLVEDSVTGRTLHWELAVKFYLGVGDTRRLDCWWGLNWRDRLDIKTSHLERHQIRLAGSPIGRDVLKSLGIHVDEIGIIVKGRLFYPLDCTSLPPADATSQHPRGFWGEMHMLAAREPATWVLLPRELWLAPLVRVPREVCSATAELLKLWREHPPTVPVCVARIQDEMEIERGFVVPAGWSARLCATNRVRTDP
jgi:hypothetical protein